MKELLNLNILRKINDFLYKKIKILLSIAFLFFTLFLQIIFTYVLLSPHAKFFQLFASLCFYTHLYAFFTSSSP